MKRETLYLDVVRLLAAMTVFMGHFSTKRLSGSFMWPINAYSDVAVTVFFVLSGFVVAYATEIKEKGLPEYCVSRLARMYSVVLPAVLLTVALDELGSKLQPALYASWNWTSDLSFLRFFTALTFTNMLWGVEVRQGTNAAYWSMGYEVPYYVIFGIMTFCRSRWRRLSLREPQDESVRRLAAALEAVPARRDHRARSPLELAGMVGALKGSAASAGRRARSAPPGRR